MKQTNICSPHKTDIFWGCFLGFPRIKSPSRPKNKNVDIVGSDIYVYSNKLGEYEGNDLRDAYGKAKEGDTVHIVCSPKEKLPRSETRKSRANLSKPRIKQKDGLFLCHFGVKYVPGIHAIGRGETIEDAYNAWKAENHRMMAKKAARKAQKANGGINGAT